MSKGDQNALLWRMLDRLLSQKNVPKNERPDKRNELFLLLKDVFNVPSYSKLTKHEKWLFYQKCEVLLSRDFGYISTEENEKELKFEDENIQN